MTSFFELLEGYAERMPQKTALMTPEYKVTYRQLYDTVAFYQKEIQSLNKDIIFIRSKYTINFVIYFLAVIGSGAWAVPISDDMTDEEYKAVQNQLDGHEINHGDEIVKICEEKHLLIKANEENSGLYHRTSGSTGEPKFCIRAVQNLLYEGLSYRNTLNITSHDIILNVPPLIHSYALGAALFGGLVSGAAICLQNGFKPKRTLEILRQEQVTILILAPYMARVLTNMAKQDLFPNHLRFALSGAGIIDASLDAQFGKKFGLKLNNNYGSTETGGLVCTLDGFPQSSLGKPMTGVEIKIKKESDNTEVFPGEGILWVKTKALMQGYADGGTVDLDEDGFFNTSDIVRIDNKQYLYYCDRKSRFINIGGKKAVPSEIEKVIITFQGVNDCHVFGETSQNNITFITAVIACEESLNEIQIRRKCRKMLPIYKIPRKIIFVRSILRNHIGKVDNRFIQSILQGEKKGGFEKDGVI